MLALTLVLETSRNWLAYLRPAFHLPEFRNSHFFSNLLFSLGIHFERDQLFTEQGSGAIFYIFRPGIFPVKQKDEKLQIRIWLGRTEENSQVQSCCCSLKRLATKMRGNFPGNSQWFTSNWSSIQAGATTHQTKSSLGAPAFDIVINWRYQNGQSHAWYRLLLISWASIDAATTVSGTRSSISFSYRLIWPKNPVWGRASHSAAPHTDALTISGLGLGRPD